MVFVWILLAALVAFAAYVRLAPSDVERWHVAGSTDAPKDFEGGALRRIEGGAQRLAQLDEIARAEPRTQVLAGDVDAGMITYITRSKLWGFPDYTTVWSEGGDLYLFARLRFGKSDIGVNRARLERWLDQL